MGLVYFECSQDLDWVGAQSVEAGTDSDEDSEGIDWLQTHCKDRQGFISVSQVTQGSEGHKKNNSEQDSSLEDLWILLDVLSFCSDIHDHCVSFENKHCDSNVAHHTSEIEVYHRRLN